MRLHERQGDLCCRLKAYQAAIALYGKQLALAEAHGVEPGELSMVYVSLARTHADWGEFSKALGYYERELELCKKNPEEVGGAVGVVLPVAYRSLFSCRNVTHGPS